VRAAPADPLAWSQARRRKACKLATRPALHAMVGAKLADRWSPEKIAGSLKTTYPDDPEMQVSHETIYRTLFIQSRGALPEELTAHLRTGRVIRRPQEGPVRRTVAVAGQRGSNENTNGLLRQYLPRTLDLRTLTQADFDAIADQLNGRPRQTLGFTTPSQVLAEVLR
jgi:IS30 family transposase